MAKSTKKSLDENGNIIQVDVPNQDIPETSDIKIDSIKKKKEPKEYIFQLIDKFYSTTSNFPRPPYPETYFVRNTDIIFDEETQTERNIRYIEGVSTIFEDEQEHLSEFKKKQRPEIKFISGILVVPSNRTSLVKFMTVSNMNESNKNPIAGTRKVYRLIDFEAQEERAINKAETRMEAMKLAMDCPIDNMIPHAQYLGVKFKNQYGEERGDKSIRVDYLECADNNPELFIKTYNNPLVKVEYLIRKAMSVNLIDIETSKGQAIWGDTKKFITQIPDRTDSVKYLSELCLTEKGKDFYNQLKTIAD
jgi:predicted transcriptional regulator